jgi:hypothetical protein
MMAESTKKGEVNHLSGSQGCIKQKILSKYKDYSPSKSGTEADHLPSKTSASVQPSKNNKPEIPL